MLTPFMLGPVELDVVLLESPGLPQAVLQALYEQVRNGTVRLVDLVVVSRSDAGELAFEDLDPEEARLAGLDLLAPGLIGEEDVFELSEILPPGSGAAIVAFELAWARDLAEELARHGGVVAATERIPAPVVNAILDAVIED